MIIKLVWWAKGVARTLGNAGNYKKAEDADREKKVVNFA